MGGGLGGPQDYCVSPSPLLALLGPFGVGTGLDWVGIGSGEIGDLGVGDQGLTIFLLQVQEDVAVSGLSAVVSPGVHSLSVLPAYVWRQVRGV